MVYFGPNVSRKVVHRVTDYGIGVVCSGSCEVAKVQAGKHLSVLNYPEVVRAVPVPNGGSPFFGLCSERQRAAVLVGVCAPPLQPGGSKLLL